MAPWLHTLRVAGLLSALLAGPFAPASHALPCAAAYEPAPGESRAGSRAGEGRERPGRPATSAEETPAATPETQKKETQETETRVEMETRVETEEEAREDDTAAAHPDSSASGDRSEAAVAPEPPGNATGRPQPSPEAEQAVSRPVGTSEPVLRVLPLGGGLVLIGLGLGLAFLALRVRRG